MASAATFRASLSFLPISSLEIPSSGLSRVHVCSFSRIPGVVRRVSYGGDRDGPIRRRRIEDGLFGVARIRKGENDVVLEEESKEIEKEEPLLLRIGVSLVTEILRVFNLGGSQSADATEEVEASAALENLNVLEALRDDYERAYFLTGEFTTTLYADDCLFADPTIQFRGRNKYQRNLKLLVPFFEEPRLTLFDIQEQDSKVGEERSINANWNLRTYLQLPWKPLIDVDGSTLYVMDSNSKIVKHIERWSISGGQAVQQLFVPSDRAVAFLRKES